MYSLRRRLLTTATILLLLFLGGMTFALNRAFEDSVLSNAEDNLRNQILLLIANIDVIEGELIVPNALPEPRFAQMDSSLFAQISRSNSIQGNSASTENKSTNNSSNPPSVLWRSPSLLDMQLPTMDSSVGVFSFTKQLDWREQPTSFATSLTLEWQTDDGVMPLTVSVAEHSSNYTKRLRRYQRQVSFGLLLTGGVLIALLLASLGWALKPLQRVTRQVAQIEAGDRERFDEDYPIEVSRLTQNLNQLLNFDEQRITRQKEVLGNLAHSLKTPIAVLKGLKYTGDVSVDAQRQLETMQSIIDYQLQSASTVGRRRFARPIEITEITRQMVSTLQKLHADKHITCELGIAEGVLFFGDQGDWMELCGNLLDNAFKWTSNKVEVRVRNLEGDELDVDNSRRKNIQLQVVDNGVGIDDQLKATIAERGVRLDSQTPGHGLGLHIVKGIVDAYSGDLTITDPLEHKGTCFTVVLR